MQVLRAAESSKDENGKITMHVQRLLWSPSGDRLPLAKLGEMRPQLVIYFAGRAMLAGPAYDQLRQTCSDAVLIGCSTGGQINDNEAVDEEVAVVGITFEATSIRLASEIVPSPAASRECGRCIGRRLLAPGLAGIFILSDGLNVNGSQLVRGISDIVGSDMPLTGGLAGDGADFHETWVGANSMPACRTVAAIGFYGSAIRIGHGSAGGWDVFGPLRRITRSRDNVLFELDSQPALDLYERYLDNEADGLPGTGLLYPLQIHSPSDPKHQIVRTMLAVDRKERSVTFAGDVPEGWTAQLMRGNFEHLCRGAADAARQAVALVKQPLAGQGVALLVSCIGRRLLMGQRVSEELDEVGAVIGKEFVRLGFYSYGEISPHAKTGICELHNQTMTVTTLFEVAA